MINKLQDWAKTRGYRIAWGDASIVMEIRKEFDTLLVEGEIDRAFYKSNLDWFVYPKGITLKEPKSVIIVAVPLAAHTLAFQLDGDELETILPPTYVKYKKLFGQVHDDLAASVIRDTCCSEILQAPLKATATRLGLATYGRNNITYIEGLGSYFQFVGILTDAELPPSGGSSSGNPKMNPECMHCTICFEACPTRAIRQKRVLLSAERCFTLQSESHEPWPRWIQPVLDRCFSAQTCLIGCLQCQVVCPRNQGLLRTEPAGISFTAAETEWILAGKPCDSHPLGMDIKAKFDEIDMFKDYRCFTKNLRELVKQL